ncbi:MAG: hypothetical protein JST16_15180 [Bdellovibrionales bacterium]|nr:hypothetical protein [Bdellovibrionales bacterium]
MLVGLSCTSSQGLWIATDPQATVILSEATWEDSNSTGLSAGTARHFEILLERAGKTKQDITGLFGVTGPGAFTGIRMSSAFLQGLARALGQPIRSVPTFDLAGTPFWIPLRHQKARELTLSEALASGMEFLHIQSTSAHQLGVPSEGELIWGLRNHPEWPEPENLLHGVRRNLQGPLGLKLDYGLEPKISGQRA